MYNIFACTMKVNITSKTYDDENQIASKGVNILHIVNINEDVEQTMNKFLMDQLLKVYKSLIIH
jgi:hypothetical protein